MGLGADGQQPPKKKYKLAGKENNHNKITEDSKEVIDLARLQKLCKQLKAKLQEAKTHKDPTPNVIEISSKSSVRIGIGAAIADPSNPKRVKNKDRMVRKGMRDFIREELYSDMKFVRDDNMAQSIVVEEGGLVVPFGVKTIQEFSATYYTTLPSSRHTQVFDTMVKRLPLRHYIGEIDTTFHCCSVMDPKI